MISNDRESDEIEYIESHWITGGERSPFDVFTVSYSSSALRWTWPALLLRSRLVQSISFFPIFGYLIIYSDALPNLFSFENSLGPPLLISSDARNHLIYFGGLLTTIGILFYLFKCPRSIQRFRYPEEYMVEFMSIRSPVLLSRLIGSGLPLPSRHIYHLRVFEMIHHALDRLEAAALRETASCNATMKEHYDAAIRQVDWSQPFRFPGDFQIARIAINNSIIKICQIDEEKTEAKWFEVALSYYLMGFYKGIADFSKRYGHTFFDLEDIRGYLSALLMLRYEIDDRSHRASMIACSVFLSVGLTMIFLPALDVLVLILRNLMIP